MSILQPKNYWWRIMLSKFLCVFEYILFVVIAWSFPDRQALGNATWKCSWPYSDLLNKLLLCECIFFNTFSCRGDNSDWSKENWLKTILERNLEGVTNFIMSKVKIVNRGIWNYFVSEKDFLNSCLKKFRYFPRYFYPRRIHFKQQLLQW